MMDDTTKQTTDATEATGDRGRFEHQDLVDDYPDYLEDTLGYRFDARDVLTLGELHRHDDLLHADPTTLEELDLEALDDLQRWAVGRNARRRGDTEAFVEAARLVLGGATDHAAIAYAEVYEATVGVLIDAGRFDEAAALLQRFREEHPDAQQVDGLEVRLAYRRDPLEGRATAEALATAHPDDGELRYELAEDLLAMGMVEEAARWLDEAEAVAVRTADRPLQGDVTLLRARLTG